VDRLICLVFVALLALPLAGMLGMDTEDYSREEGRGLAALPDLPRDLDEWNAYPAALKRYAADHFGGRQWLREADARMKRALGVSSKPGEVLVGRQGWLFHVGVLGRNLQQFERELADPIVGYFREIQSILADEGVPLVMAMIPHKMQVYPEYVPGDYQAPTPRYYQEVISQRILDEGRIDYVDLLPVLLDEKARQQDNGEAVCFQRDTHWNMYGANAAQYAIARRLSHHLDFTPRRFAREDFILKDPADAVYPEDPIVNEFFSYYDRLTSMLGLSEPWTEPYPLPRFVPQARVAIDKQRRFRLLRSADAPANRVLIVHDSGTLGLAPYFSQYFSEALYWWTSAPSLLEFRELVRFYQPDAVLWQTSQNVLAASGFESRLPGRLAEFEQLIGHVGDDRRWRKLYRWSGSTEAGNGTLAESARADSPLLSVAAGKGGQSRLRLALPGELSEQMSGRRVKVAVEASVRSERLFNFFTIDLSSEQRQCDCVSRLLVGDRRFVSEAFFRLPADGVAGDVITLSPTTDARLQDLSIHGIAVYVDMTL
jgi:hypothetical protein